MLFGGLCVCLHPVPFECFFFFFFCAKYVWFVRRHWKNNQQDLRVGLGFLQAVILRILLHHIPPSPLCPNDAFVDVAVTWVPRLLVSREERKKYPFTDECLCRFEVNFFSPLVTFYLVSENIQYHSWSGITNKLLEPTVYNHLSCLALSSPTRHPCHSEDTWGAQTKKKDSAPLTLKMEVIPALHISLRVRRQGHAGAAQRNTSTLVQKLSRTALIDYCKGATVALAHGCTSYVAAECSHLVSREWNHAPGKSRL